MERKTLDELRAAALPRATTANTFTVRPKGGGDLTEAQQRERDEIAAKLDPYLADFVPFQKECICCGRVLVGTAPEVLLGLGTFRWGLCNGEGECSECGWPSRVYHDVPDAISWELALQYHPDALESAPPKEDPAP